MAGPFKVSIPSVFVSRALTQGIDPSPLALPPHSLRPGARVFV
jgi:hypothetical protein